MISRVMKWFNDIGIRYKLFISFLAVITLPICLFLIVNMYYTSNEAEQQTYYSLGQVQSQTKSLLEYKAESLKNLLDMLVLNDTLVEISTKKNEYYADNIGFWMDDNGKLTKVFYINQYFPDIASHTFYMRSGLASVVETDEYKRLSTVEDSAWFRQLIENGNKVQWVRGIGGKQTISAVKSIINTQDLSNISGIISLDIPVSVLRATLDKSLFTESTSAYIVNSANEVICSSKNTTGTNYPGLLSFIESGKGAQPGKGWVNERISGEDFVLGSEEIVNTDWRFVLAIPYRDIRMVGDKTRQQMLLILLIVAPLTLPLSFVVSASVTKRIRKLIMHMNKVVDGNFNVGILPANNDEIGQLTRNFNYMLTKMSMLIDEKFKMGQEMKNLELKSLQAQINPHFLYNTLDLIDWISVKDNSIQASKLVKAMSRFYKLSLSNGKDIVTIENEIEHVKTYVQIQNMRFENKINLLIDIPDTIYNCLIPKIILQPLVENSILHGILERNGESGTIGIQAEILDHDIRLIIHDDGAGMSNKILSYIPRGVATNESHGYGVQNIDERLKLYYGSGYGLSYKSEEGKGTTVEIRIKAIHKEEGKENQLHIT